MTNEPNNRTIEIGAAIEFLEDAARHFERRPTGGEDMAFWANVYNAENCRLIADLLARTKAPHHDG